MKDLLFEIGVEELPAGFINPAMVQLAELFAKKAEEGRLAYETLSSFGTPRRLALLVNGCAQSQADIEETVMGPAASVAFNEDGTPTKAGIGFARSKGVGPEKLTIVSTQKGEYVQLVRQVRGAPAAEVLPRMLTEIIAELSFAKSMKWGSQQQSFARPIQWLAALFGDEPIPLSYGGVDSAPFSYGHRFMAPAAIALKGAEHYEEQMESAYVIASFDKRRQAVLDEIHGCLKNGEFGEQAAPFIDENLLATVTNLVEYPVGVSGRFDERFLALPDEVLITSMREHQKYFPIVDGNNRLLPGFIAVNNTRVRNAALTGSGHERVLRARLADALFFYEADQKTALAQRVEDGAGIIFQASLGTMREKVDRIVKLTTMLAEQCAPEHTTDAARTALLAKADLTTEMVGEFPSLQGIMGSAYGVLDGESAEVAAGIKDHYKPLRAGAALPDSVSGALVSIADRIDTLAGCFGIGQVPTGTTDPYGLRRHAIAVLHIIEDREYRLNLAEVFSKALSLYGDKVDGSAATVDALVAFIKTRFSNDCLSRGHDGGAVEAACAAGFADINDTLLRIRALEAMKADASFAVLAASCKRIRNIIKDHQGDEVDEQLLREPAERALYESLNTVLQAGSEKLERFDYQGFLRDMLVLKEPIDRFFDEVMVMAEDAQVRRNRLNLLSGLARLMNQVGDIGAMS
jgi:glycyl-tRNA synthetase beta chain